MSRKYFGTDGVRGYVGNSVIQPDFVMKLGFAAGRILIRQETGHRPAVIIGKDTRVSGYLLEAALTAGFTHQYIVFKFVSNPFSLPIVLVQ